MNDTNEKVSKYPNLELAIMIVPTVGLARLAGDIETSVPQIAMAAILGGLGGGIGGLLLWLVKGKSKSVLISVLLLTIIGLFLMAWLVT